MLHKSLWKIIIDSFILLNIVMCLNGCRSITSNVYEINYEKNRFDQKKPTSCVLKHIESETNRDLGLYLETVDCNLFFQSVIKKLGGKSDKNYNCDELGLFMKKIWNANNAIGASKGLKESDKKTRFYIEEYYNSSKTYARVNVDSTSVYNLYNKNGQWIIFKAHSDFECKTCLIDTLERNVSN